jgi:hypothetical protein
VTFLKKFRSQGIAKLYALLNQQISTKVLGQKARRLPNQAKFYFYASTSLLALKSRQAS